MSGAIEGSGYHLCHGGISAVVALDCGVNAFLLARHRPDLNLVNVEGSIIVIVMVHWAGWGKPDMLHSLASVFGTAPSTLYSSGAHSGRGNEC